MNNLSQECIEQIEKEVNLKWYGYPHYKKLEVKDNMISALANPIIYQSAGLIKAEDALPATFKTEAVNTILVNALRFLNDEQLSHLLKAICQRNTNATQSAGLMTVEEAKKMATQEYWRGWEDYGESL